MLQEPIGAQQASHHRTKGRTYGWTDGQSKLQRPLRPYQFLYTKEVSFLPTVKRLLGQVLLLPISYQFPRAQIGQKIDHSFGEGEEGGGGGGPNCLTLHLYGQGFNQNIQGEKHSVY